jgi:hypothetical protein
MSRSQSLGRRGRIHATRRIQIRRTIHATPRTEIRRTIHATPRTEIRRTIHTNRERIIHCHETTSTTQFFGFSPCVLVENSHFDGALRDRSEERAHIENETRVRRFFGAIATRELERVQNLSRTKRSKSTFFDFSDIVLIQGRRRCCLGIDDASSSRRETDFRTRGSMRGTVQRDGCGAAMQQDATRCRCGPAMQRDAVAARRCSTMGRRCNAMPLRPAM